MKKIIIIATIICTILCPFSNVYAANIINDTRNTLVNIYDDMTNSIDGNNSNMNNNGMMDNDSAMENAVDGLSIGITVAAIVITAGVIFYYLVPKK